MKTQNLILCEQYASNAVPPKDTVCQIVAAWLTKELHK